VAIGGAIALPSGRQFVNDLLNGADETVKTNGPELRELVEHTGSEAKELAPDSVIAPTVTIPMAPITSVAGLGDQ
jgi:hypothetical protein